MPPRGCLALLHWPRIVRRLGLAICLLASPVSLPGQTPGYEDLTRSGGRTTASSSPAKPQPTAVLRRKIRVLHQNIYGRDENGCEERYRTIAKNINGANPPFDVVCLNEHFRSGLGETFGYVCDPDVLTEAIAGGGIFGKGPDKSRRHHPRSYAFGNFDGGLDVWTRHKLGAFESYVFENSGGLGEVYGFILARIDFGDGVAVDFWITHLAANVDDCDRACRDVQLHHFADYVHYSSGSGRRTKAGEHYSPVILLGDFNIGAPTSASQRKTLEKAIAAGDKEAVEKLGKKIPGNNGYQDVMARFNSPTDAWLETHPDDPGYTLDSTHNTIEAKNERAHERIDQVLIPRSLRFSVGPFFLKVASIELVKWKTPAGVSVSDHFGLDMTLEVWEREASPRPPPGPGSFRVRAGRVQPVQ